MLAVGEKEGSSQPRSSGAESAERGTHDGRPPQCWDLGHVSTTGWDGDGHLEGMCVVEYGRTEEDDGEQRMSVEVNPLRVQPAPSPCTHLHLHGRPPFLLVRIFLVRMEHERQQ
jgi:hypothetical protein